MSSNESKEPAAWLVDGGLEYQYVSLFRESADAAADEEGGTVTPLYRSPTLTDAEREAVAAGVRCVEYVAAHGQPARADLASSAATLRGLLERLSPPAT